MLHGMPYIFYQLVLPELLSDCFCMSFQSGADDYERKDEGVHCFRFLALWWWLYSGKSSGQVILYLVIRGWALPRFLSGSQVSSAVEYPFHLIKKVQ